jgi:3-deoxy-manno-octulosonate cytidylyltransferase (CMP-KDO synthetase)
MIEHVCRRAAAARSVGAVVVATDDERVAEAVEAFGGIAWMTASSHRSGSDRLAEVAAHLTSPVIVNVQGDEPLIDPATIEAAIAPLSEDPTLAMSTVRRRITDEREWRDPNVVKVVVDRGGFALYFSRAPIPYCREPGVPRQSVYRHIGLYVYRRDFLIRLASLAPTPLERAESLEQLRALEHGYRIRVVGTAHPSVAVDTPEDLERVRRLAAAGLLR